MFFLFQFQIRSVLSIVPSKENDGSTYRCTVWNRALGQSRKFEASTDIFVNCEFKDDYRSHLNNGGQLHF